MESAQWLDTSLRPGGYGPFPELAQALRPWVAMHAEKGGRLYQAGQRAGVVEGRGQGLLRQLVAVRVEHYGQVQIVRDGQAEEGLQDDVARCRGQQVGAPDDVVDALLGVVDDHGEVVGIDAVGALQDEVTTLAGDGAGDTALLAVDEGDACFRYAQPQGGGL